MPGSSERVPTAISLAGAVIGGAIAHPIEAALLPSGHQCLPPPLGTGRLGWPDIRKQPSLRQPRECGEVNLAQEEVALCVLAKSVAGDSNELLLAVGVAERVRSLNATLRSAAQHLGGGRLLLLALDDATAQVIAARFGLLAM